MLKIYNNPLLRQYVTVISVNLCILVTGLSIAWPSPVLVKLNNSTQTVFSRPITEDEGSWIVSIGCITGIASSFLFGYLVDKVGRKYSMILGCLPRMIAGFMLIFATEVWMVLLAKALNAITDAAVYTLVPIYTSEIASKEIRGSLGTIIQIMSSCGIVIMLSMGPFLSYVTLNIIFTAMMILTTIPLLLLPDSPYFLYSKDKKEEALNVLIFYRGSEEIARQEIKQYEEDALKNHKVNRKEIITQRYFLKSLFLACVLAAACQFSGFNAVAPYLQSILEDSQTSVKPEIASIVIGIIQLLGSFGATFTTDKLGRKPVLAISCISMGLGMVGLGTFFKLKQTTPVTGMMNFLPLASLIIIVFSYNAGLGTLFWVLAAELFDDKSRGLGMTIVTICSSLSLFPTTKCFALVSSTIGFAMTYWTFGIICVLICLFVLYFIPETKNKSFSEIQDILRSKSSNDECVS